MLISNIHVCYKCDCVHLTVNLFTLVRLEEIFIASLPFRDLAGKDLVLGIFHLETLDRINNPKHQDKEFPNLRVKTISLRNNMDDWVDHSVLAFIKNLHGRSLIFVRGGIVGIRVIMNMMEMIKINFR